MFPTGFDLKSLFVFACVVETGGMTQAARALEMTQSSVSQSVGNLETALGTALFDRSVRPMVLTHAGNTFYMRSKEVLEGAGNLLRNTQESENLSFESLTLGLVESFANTVGPHLIMQLPNLAKKWRILAGTSPDQHEALTNYEVDMIVSTDDHGANLDALSEHAILEEQFVLVFPKSYRGPVEGINVVEGLPFIRYSLRSSIGRQVERQISRMRLHFPVHSEFETAMGQLALVGMGAGWSITTPMCLLQERNQLEKIQVHPIKRGRFSRKFTLVTRAGGMEKTAEVVAKKSQKILREQLFPDLFKQLPWLEQTILWGEST